MDKIGLGLACWALATGLDWLPREPRTTLIAGHVATSILADNSDPNCTLRSSLAKAVVSFSALAALTASAPRHLTLCHAAIRLSISELGVPVLRYLRFQDTDEEMMGRLIRGLLAMSSFGAPVLIPLLARVVWSHLAVLSGVSAGAMAIAFLIGAGIRNRQEWPLMGRLAASTTTYRILRFMADIYNGVVDHTSLRMAARHLEAWEARRSKGACASLPRLVYDPLDDSRREFRILRVRRRTLWPELRCEFVKASVDNPPPFEAISYTWGGEKQTENIAVGGCRLPVAPTVWKLLWYRRSFWSEAYLWIDAVCINQESIPERNTQVRLMGDIYRLASRTLVWLAHPLDAKDSAAARRELMILSMLNASQASVETVRTMIQGSAIMPAFVSLLSRSYFNRIWIVQEVALAREVNVMYGHALLEWDSLAGAVAPVFEASLISRVTSHSPRPDIVGQHMASIINISRLRMLCRRERRPDLNEALRGTLQLRTLASTDARDKIFGLLGIISDASHDKMPVPDYNESTHQVYVRTARYLLGQELPSLALLQYAGIGYEKTRLGSLPSWVPDWTCPLLGARISLPNLVKYFSESSRIRPGLQVTVDTSDTVQLEVDAKILDTILVSTNNVFNPETISRSPSALDDDGGLSAAMISFVDQITALVASSHPTRLMYPGEDLTAAIFYTVIGATRVSTAELGSAETTLSLFRMAMLAMRSPTRPFMEVLKQLMASNGGSTSDAELAILGDKMARLFFVIGDSVGCKTFCVLASGRLALCPPGSQQGDVLAHLRGAPVPFVMRRIGAAGSGRCQLVGSCFVYGLEDEDKAVDGWEGVVLE